MTEAAMRGELDFAQSLHARVAVLAGLPADVVDAVRAEVKLSEGAAELVAAFHAAGHVVAVVSGGFNQILQPIAEDLGLDYWIANELEIVDGALTGKVLGEVIDRAAKEKYLREWAAAEGIPMEHTIAVGDGANDLDMLGPPGSAWRSTPNPPSARWRMPPSTCPTSTPCGTSPASETNFPPDDAATRRHGAVAPATAASCVPRVARMLSCAALVEVVGAADVLGVAGLDVGGDHLGDLGGELRHRVQLPASARRASMAPGLERSSRVAVTVPSIMSPETTTREMPFSARSGRVRAVRPRRRACCGPRAHSSAWWARC